MNALGRWFPLVALTCVGWVATPTASAFEPFEVSDIRLEGVERFAPGTVFNALPVEVGDRVSEESVARSVRSLYETGFFQDVAIKRDDDVLVIELVERPTVARIKIDGNDEIEEKDLRKGLRDSGLAEGETFNESSLSEIERGLREQYFALGIYDITVESTVSPLPRNRVGVRIDIDEGDKALVDEVQFVGNDAFDDDALRDEIELGPAAWWQIIGDAGTYSRQRLGSDLETVRAFYRNRGYLNFSISSTQVSISEDRRRVHVTVNIDEGEQYRVGDVKLAGNLIFPEDELQPLLEVAEGELFSQQAVSDSSSALQEKLGERGYAFANINSVPDADEETNTVDVTFFVDPAERMYVRRINITGNERTRDDVIRRELLQQEGASLSTGKLEESRRRLGRLGFFGQVDIETPRVPDSDNQVDVNVDVEEQLTGKFNIGAGFSDENGFTLQLGVQQDNVLGSGDRIKARASNDDINTVYELSYKDRFHTKEGIDRNISLRFQDTNAREANLSDFGVQRLTAEYGYTIPLGLNDSLGVSAEFEDIELNLSDNPTRIQRRFDAENPEGSQVYRLAVDWTRDSRDRSRFPREGSRQNLGTKVSIPGSDLNYHRTQFTSSNYFPVSDWFTLIAKGNAAFGDSFGDTARLPFFENFFAGGSRSVRGYENNSLGPRDENNDPIGGNVRLRGNVELRFPPPWSDKGASTRGGVRFRTFVDGGNVWFANREDIDSDDIKYSAGVGVTWFAPIGPLTASLARPLNADDDDQTRLFQFSIGANF